MVRIGINPLTWTNDDLPELGEANSLETCLKEATLAGYEGVEAVHQQYREWVIDAHFPANGAPTQPVEAGIMANSWIRLRHPDYDSLRDILDDIGRTVKVNAH